VTAGPAEQALALLDGRPLAIASVRADDLGALARAVRPAAILACEGGADARALARSVGAVLHTLDERGGVREIWNEAGVNRLSELPLPRSVVVVSYCASASLERVVPGRLLAPPAALKRRLDDKFAVRALLREAGIPVPRSEIAGADEVLAGGPGRRLGYPLVVQRRFGSTGAGTAIAWEPSAAADAARIADPGEPLLVSAFAGRATLNVHGVAYDGGAAADPASVQATGIAALGGHSARYCGNDFAAAAALLGGVREGARALARRVGALVAGLGFRGGFGVDLALSDGGALSVIEVNPRLQGSTALLSELQEEVGGTPVALRHALALLGAGPPVEEEPDPPAGAMLILRRDVTAQAPPATTGRDHGIRIRARPGPGVRVAPGAVLARAYARGPLVEADGRRLTPAGEEAVAALAGAPAGGSGGPLPSSR
jgi:ATP-grasp domain